MASINPCRYRGYYQDNETGFYYLNTRYYDPSIRRFINQDNLELIPQLSQTLGQLNLYAYCNNNPVMYTDPNGESFVLALFIIGFIVGFTYGGIDAHLKGENEIAGALVNGVIGGLLVGFGWGFAWGLGLGFTGSLTLDIINGNEINLSSLSKAAIKGLTTGIFASLSLNTSNIFDKNLSGYIAKFFTDSVIALNLGTVQFCVNFTIDKAFNIKTNSNQSKVQNFYIVKA